MNDSKKTVEMIHSHIWAEEAEPDNPFAAAVCYCSGYDVYGDLLGKASWSEYLYLLFMGERPTPVQARLLESLAVALANPGPRDYSVQAAMTGAIGQTTSAAPLICALVAGSGNYQGSREVFIAVNWWLSCGQDIEKWQAYFAEPPQEERIDVWIPLEHPPGFDPHGVSCPTPVRQVLCYLAEISPGNTLKWLQEHRTELETMADCSLAMSGVATAAFIDLGCSAEQAEILYLLLRLPGAAAHALEQCHYGVKRFPFFKDGLELLPYP